MKLPCDTCNGDGFVSFGDRHIENRKESCATCGGTGEIEARTGERPESSAPLAITDTMAGSLVGKLRVNSVYADSIPTGGDPVPTLAPPDPVVEAVRADLLRRSQFGLAKYGTPLSRTDLDLRAWLNHAYEEALDFSNYLKRSIMELDGTLGSAPAPAPAPAATPGVPDSLRALLLETLRFYAYEQNYHNNMPLNQGSGNFEGANRASIALAALIAAQPAGQSAGSRAEETKVREAVSSALHDNQFLDGWPEMVGPVVNAVLAARTEAPVPPTPVIDVQPMRLSSGKSDYFVRVRCGDREQTLFKLVHRYEAQYTADGLSWLLGLRPDKPDLLAYDETSHPND